MSVFASGSGPGLGLGLVDVNLIGMDRELVGLAWQLVGVAGSWRAWVGVRLVESDWLARGAGGAKKAWWRWLGHCSGELMPS